MDDDQDIKSMGGLAKLMPITAVTFLIGWLSIAGVPPFSGFWSKGDVLENAWALTPALWVIAALTAALTAYYMGREYFLVFLGERRWVEARPPQPEFVADAAPGGDTGHRSDAAVGHGHDPSYTGRGVRPHDAAWPMTFPLIVLAVLATLGGFANLPFHPDLVFLERWLNPVVGASVRQLHYHAGTEWLFAIADAAFALTGVAVATVLWRNATDRPAVEPRFLFMAWFLDWAEDTVLAKNGERLASFTSAVVESKAIDGVVNGLATLVGWTGERLRRVQTGYVRTYALGLVAGLVAIGAFLLVRVAS
jgi:NADH-quinone oxidoreductase subunit L